MLTRIETAHRASRDSDDVISLLLGCHERIRHFTAVALKLSRPEAPPAQVAAAAAAVYRYYSQALPLHEADENESVYPRLREAIVNQADRPTAAPADDRATQRALADANEAMLEQHRRINAHVAQLLPRWQSLAAGEPDPGAAAATAPLAEELRQAWQEHLGLEERLVFPAIVRLLSPADQSAIRAEMKARRLRVDPDRLRSV